MTTYTDVFGGANIYPSEISYEALTLTADVVLSWPEETSTNQDLAAKIIDVTPSAAGFSVILPDAMKAGTGQTILFNNKGAFSFTVKKSTGVQVTVLASSEVWQVYLTDNSTVGGTWVALQYGATTSLANASALAGTGLVAIGAQLFGAMPIQDFNSDYTPQTNDRAYTFNWTGAGGNLFLPEASTVGNNWFIAFRNSGDGSVIVNPAGSVMIDGSSTKIYQPGESSLILSDGLNYYSVGYGKDAVFAFDYTSVAVAGSGNYILSGAELNRIAYSFTGVLTGDRDIIVPDTVQQYWVTNDTTGPYLLTVKTAAGTGISVGRGESSIMYCNGLDVVNASTGGLAVPISISQGGTAATTASGARINLGGTSVGIAVFTAVDQNTAFSALGRAPAGVVEGGAF